MSAVEIQRALQLLKDAQRLLKHSELENLQKSAEYLEQSIHWLKQQERQRSLEQTC